MKQCLITGSSRKSLVSFARLYFTYKLHCIRSKIIWKSDPSTLIQVLAKVQHCCNQVTWRIGFSSAVNCGIGQSFTLLLAQAIVTTAETSRKATQFMEIELKSWKLASTVDVAHIKTLEIWTGVAMTLFALKSYRCIFDLNQSTCLWLAHTVFCTASNLQCQWMSFTNSMNIWMFRIVDGFIIMTKEQATS